MLKLMKLEIQKFKIRIRGVIIANLIMLASSVLIIVASLNSKDLPFSDYNNMFAFTGSIVRAVLMVFAAVLISRLLIDEYKNKTINVLFMYPIKRRKIMISKLFIIVIFTFVGMFLSEVFLNFNLYILNIFAKFIKEPFTVNILLENLIHITIYSAIFSFVSLIPVYFGMRKKSGSATIVTAVILISVFNSGSSNTTLSSYILIPIIGAILGIIGSFIAIKDIEELDVIS
ncbi:MAG: ABC transporter permease [Clostridiaceae bacterium]|nr:ABC transporter permease [Clostridiaceae bacterium]